MSELKTYSYETVESLVKWRDKRITKLEARVVDLEASLLNINGNWNHENWAVKLSELRRATSLLNDGKKTI